MRLIKFSFYLIKLFHEIIHLFVETINIRHAFKSFFQCFSFFCRKTYVEVEKGALEAFNYSCSDLINKILSFNYKIFSLRNKVLFTIENINDIPIEGHDDVICFNLNIKDHLLYFNNLLKLCTKV